MQPKILLVDDREDNLLSLEAILEPDGYKLVKATSGRQALRILLTDVDFAMILMDVKMPNLNGFETASLINEREKLKNIPFIFITAEYYGDDNTGKGYRSGAADFIFKPISPDLLRLKVRVLVELYKKTTLLLEQEQKLIAINRALEIEINERQAAEAKVQQVNRKLIENLAHLESANRDLERFAFMASHDLQEPLRKIRIFSDILYVKYKDVLNEDVKMITRINHAADRMRNLVVDILAFSKLSMEKTDFTISDLNEILKGLLMDMDEEVKKKKATILIDPIPPLNVSTRLMYPLFQNLINNALKYKKEDVDPVIRIRSELSLAISDQDSKNLVNKYCRIFVEDNGIGFEQKYSEEIFEMFKRLHNNGEFEGTGVGLALCKKITELHHGFISARSKVNEGSTFIISLPIKQEAS